MKVRQHPDPSFDVDHKGDEYMRSHCGVWFKWVEDSRLEIVIDFDLKDELEYQFQLEITG